MTKRYFEFSEGSSHKFWEVWREGAVVTTRYGKIGTPGQTTLKDQGGEAAAEKLWAKLISEKTKKGYLERGAAQAAAAPVQQKRAASRPVTPNAKTSGSQALTRESLRGKRICLRGTFALGAIKDLERALKDLGARTTKFWTDADVIFTGEGGALQPYSEGYAEARRKQVPQRALTALLGDLGAVHAARTKKAAPAAQKVALDPADAAFRKAFWANPDDLTALKVWADALIERGDERGEFIRLCMLEDPSEEQYERSRTMLKKLGGKLVGPARPFVRTFDFDQHGLVRSVTAEAPRVVEGFDLIAALHPRLRLSVTSLRTKTMAVIAELRKHPLGLIHTLDLSANGLSDGACAALAPGLEGLKRLDLSHNDVTGQGLGAMAPHLKRLERLALNCSMAQLNAQQGASVLAGWVEALTSPGSFPSLQVLALPGGYRMPQPTPADRKRLEARVTIATRLDDA